VSYWVFILCFAIAAVTALGVGALWFSLCPWDELFNCRNYKSLAVTIPITFALTFLFFGFPGQTQTKLVPVEATTPCTPPKPVKKHRKKKVKAEDSDEQNRGSSEQSSEQPSEPTSDENRRNE
jgi:hypothetical protein